MIVEKAHLAESQNRLEEAANCYEEWLRENPGDTASVINLSVLYWYSTDVGVHSFLGLSSEFIEMASKRSRELLDQLNATSIDPEAVFWRLYFDYADWDRDIAIDVQKIIKNFPDCLVPHFMLVMNGVEPVQAEVVARLRKYCEGMDTIKMQYIRSVLDSCITSL